MINFLCIWLLEMSLLNFRDPCWKISLDIFLRMTLESPGNQLVKSTNIYWCQGQFLSWGSLDILRIFTELNFTLLNKSIATWLRNIEAIWMIREFAHRKSKYFLMIIKTDSTSWHFDVTTEPLLALQGFLNTPLGNFCQNQRPPFFCFLLAPAFITFYPSNIWTTWLCFQRSLLRKDVTYP